MTFLRLTLLVLLTSTTLGCHISDSRTVIKGNKHITTESREMDKYFEVEVNGDFKVELIQSADYKIEVTADENLQNYIYTEVISHRLIIGLPSNTILKGSKEIQIRVPAGFIKKLELKGINKLVTTKPLNTDSLQLYCIGASKVNIGLNTKHLELVAPGASKIEITGKTHTFAMRLEGASSIQTLDFAAQSVNVSLAGAGKIELSVDDSLEVYLSGAGMVYFKGNPKHKNFTINGFGKIEPIETN